MDDSPSRRSLLASTGALALSGVAGCLGGRPGDSAPAPADPTDAPEETAATTTTDDPADAAVDWSEVAAFRTWLTDHSTFPSTNHRFDYQEVDLDGVAGSGRAGFLGLDAADVDGFLVQSGNAIFLGSFDAAALTDAVESSDEHEVTGEYEGYVTAEATETRTELAVGDDAVLAGAELSAWIDARRGDRDRLEEVDPVFTHLFRRLPDRGLLTAQYGSPTGGEIRVEEIYAWGHSMASLDADAATWVYVLEDAATEAVVADLEAGLDESVFTESVTDVAVDGRTVTVTATPTTLP